MTPRIVATGLGTGRRRSPSTSLCNGSKLDRFRCRVGISVCKGLRLEKHSQTFPPTPNSQQTNSRPESRFQLVLGPREPRSSAPGTRTGLQRSRESASGGGGGGFRDPEAEDPDARGAPTACACSSPAALRARAGGVSEPHVNLSSRLPAPAAVPGQRLALRGTLGDPAT